MLQVKYVHVVWVYPMNGIIQNIDQLHIFLLRVTVGQYVTGRRYQKVRNSKQFILIIFDIPNIKKNLKEKVYYR